jgi:hypothetical protein
VKRPKGDMQDKVLNKEVNLQQTEDLSLVIGQEKSVDTNLEGSMQEALNRSMEDAKQDSGEKNLVEHRERGNSSVAGLDPGKFMNEEAYCPSSPAQAKKIPDLSVILNSPVFHSKTAKTIK